jgi:hypothetical protein
MRNIACKARRFAQLEGLGYDLVDEIEADAEVKVVTFESANPDFFIAWHVRASSRHGVPGRQGASPGAVLEIPMDPI